MMSNMTDNDKQDEERYDVIHEFIMNNDTGISKEHHYRDAREFLVHITKFYDIFSKLKSESFCYINTKQITNKEDQLKIMKETLYTNNEFNTGKLELKQYCVKFLQEDRDEYSIVKKIIDIYNFKNRPLNYKQIQIIKNQLEFYLINEFNYLKKLSSLMMKNGNNKTNYNSI